MNINLKGFLISFATFMFLDYLGVLGSLFSPSWFFWVIIAIIVFVFSPLKKYFE